MDGVDKLTHRGFLDTFLDSADHGSIEKKISANFGLDAFR
jgi:hypothetical protein